jgi:hypothetical protein
MKGTLPWQGLQFRHQKEKFEAIAKLKMVTTPEVLCQDLPHQMALFVSHIRSLAFDEKPNYDFLRRLVNSMASSLGIKLDFDYDWIDCASCQKTRTCQIK